MRKNNQFVTTFIALAVASAVCMAQDRPAGAELQYQLEAKYTLTAIADDNSAIVTPGSALILLKNGFVAGEVSTTVFASNSYKNGRIKSIAVMQTSNCWGGRGPGTPKALHRFGSADRLYVTRITVDQDRNEVIFDLISDSLGSGGRYKGSLRIELPGGSLESSARANVEPLIAQVFQIAPGEEKAVVSVESGS